MSNTRFDDYGGFPRNRRVFVLPEPGPKRKAHVTTPSRLPKLPAAAPDDTERLILAYLEERAGTWHRLIDVVKALNLTPKPVVAVLDRAWRKGIVGRRVTRAFQPMELREFIWRGGSTT